MRCWARANRAPATSFIARVIFCVDLTLEMRLRISFRFAMGVAAEPSQVRTGSQALPTPRPAHRRQPSAGSDKVCFPRGSGLPAGALVSLGAEVLGGVSAR